MNEDINFRIAQADDLPTLVGMLADDHLGALREDFSDPINPAYVRAFEAITNDPNNELIVAEFEGEVIGTLQMTIYPNLSFKGGNRCMIQSVRIKSELRGGGIGSKLMEWSVERAKEKGCVLIELASNKKRPDAIRFYKKLGFEASHEGFKLML